MAQSQDIRRERKRQRRAQRKQRGSRGRWNDLPLDAEPGVVVVVAPPGRQMPSEIELPDTRLSDSLVALMEEYIPWPPARNKLELMEDWLRLGARVWNLTLRGELSRRGELREALERDASSLCAEVDGAAIVESLAERKRRLFPTDRRRVLDVQVTLEKGRAMVRATGAWYTR